MFPNLHLPAFKNAIYNIQLKIFLGFFHSHALYHRDESKLTPTIITAPAGIRVEIHDSSPLVGKKKHLESTFPSCNLMGSNKTDASHIIIK